MNIDIRLIPILESIKFAERYKLLCDNYSDFKKSMDKKCFQEIEFFLQEKKIKYKFIKGEAFFKITENIGSYTIQLNIIPYAGFIQFVLDIKYNKERLGLGWGIWESIIEELRGFEVKKPVFTNYIDLQEILKEAFSIYEDFKEEVVKQEII